MNAKQRRFIEEYLLDSNATKAAIRAGYSPKTANEQGARLLANASVAAELAKAQAERSERTAITADNVLKELWENARLARELGKMDASNRALELCDKHLGALIDRYHVTSDKNEALDELTELLGVTREELLAFHSERPLVS